MTKSDHRYTIMLMVLDFFLLVESGQSLLMRDMPESGMNEPATQWVLLLTAYISAMYDAAITCVLILRAKRPEMGRIATTALNIALLPAFPIGTVIGIYGLRKVDKSEAGGK